MIAAFLAWLDLLEAERDRLRFRVMIHESADVPASEQYWADLVGVDKGAFDKTTLKKHNPKTVRKNVGDSYRGCLVISVLRSADLYRRIEGTWYGIVGAATRRPDQVSGLVENVPPWCNWQHCGFWCHLSGFESWRGSHARFGP